jgi:long-subunit fatty acid transport protein
MKKIILLLPLAIFLLLPGMVFGQAKVGTAGAQFLEIGVSARAIGMGEAFLGVADDASALYYNPGALSLLTQKEVVFTHVQYPADIQYEFVGFVMPMPRLAGSFGAAFYALHTDNMPVTNYKFPRGNGQTWTSRDYAMGLSYSAGLTDRFSFGITVKYITQLLAAYRATGWAMDLGTYYDTGFRNFKICMAISNFGPDMAFVSEEYPLPIDFRFGTAIDVIQTESSRLTAAVQGSHPNDNLEKYNAGLEYWFNDMFALRFGKKFNYDYYDKGQIGDGLTFGAGAKLNFSSYRLSVDYAYQDLGYLDSVNRFTFGIRF